MWPIQQNSVTAAQRRILIYLVDDTDGKAAETGVTVVAGDIKISKNGGAEANHGGTWTEIAGGLYYYEFTQAELDTLGFLSWRLVKTGIRTFVKELQVVPWNPYDANMGLTNLDAAVSTRAPEAGGNVAAIKTKTDQLVFTIANKVDASIQDAASFAQAAADKVWLTAARALTDKVGFALSAAGILAIWDQLLTGLVAAGSIGKKIADWVLGSDNKAILSNNAHTGAVIPTVTAVTNDVGITQAGADKVWLSASRTLTAFSTALALSVWDVLETAILTASSIGLKVKNNLDAAITTRSSHTVADVWTSGTRTLTSFGTLVADIWANSTRTLTALGSSLVAEIWNALTSGMSTAGSVGKLIADNLNATISSRSSHAAADVWTVATRALTGFGTLVSDIWSHDLSTTDEDVITGRKGASVLMALFKRFYYKVTQSGTQQIVYKADNVTAFGTMSTTEGPPQEKAKAA